MKPGIPWSVKGIGPEVREAAKHAARKAGMTLGEWLNTVILDQSDEDGEPSQPLEEDTIEDFFANQPEAYAPRREDTTVRLEDIAQQLSRLAQRERESATILPYEAPRARQHDNETLTRILNRIVGNERQAVEAFTAVNERLSVLGRQIANAPRPKSFEKPEDVPGFASLETAIRNVVEHIEVGEKRTRETLKSMQDRLGEMSQRATEANADDLIRAAPAFTSLEHRIAELAVRLERNEVNHQSGLPDLLRKEINQLAGRIETVRQSSEQMAGQAQSAAAGAAQRELRDIEGRILGLLKEAQGALASQSNATASDLQRLRAEIAATNRRLDESKVGHASDRDVNALRVAVEQLSTRVAQGPDMRPLQEMDRRIGEITRKLEQNQSATRNLPQFGELDRRIAELDHRLSDAVRLQGDGKALAALEQQIQAVNERVGRTEEQFGHLETMERAIRQLYDGLEESRGLVAQAADDAATRAAERVMAASQAQVQPSPELKALEDGLRAARESAANSDLRNQETLEAVHETLEQIVNKLAELETASAGHQLAANLAQQAMEMPAPPAAAAAVVPQPSPFFDPAGAFPEPVFAAPEPRPPQPEIFELTPPMAPPASPPVQPTLQASPSPLPGFPATSSADEPSEDLIALARRVAQAAATRGSSIGADAKPAARPGANSRFKLTLPFRKDEKFNKPVTYVGGKPVVETKSAPAASTKRRKLILGGILALAAIAAITVNLMARGGKPMSQTSDIEAPVSVPKSAGQPVATRADLGDHQGVGTVVATGTAPDGTPVDVVQDSIARAVADNIVTSSLSAQKTEASLTSIIAEPGSAPPTTELPDMDVGSEGLRAAAAAGDVKAQFIVASRYLDGQSVAQDLPKAAKWYELSASQGLAPAQYRLATLFERGKGVPQDVATALLWYERAAEGGNVKAMHNAAVIAAGNQAGTPNYDKAFRWFKLAAEHGLKDSQFNLAVLFERGLGTRADKTQAYLWYTLAGKQGDQDAAKRAAQMVASLPPADLAAANAKVAAWTPAVASDDANVVAITDANWNTTTDPATGKQAAAPVPQPAPTATANPVLEVQQLLSLLGFNIGQPDGRMGSRTQNAIRLFELQSGLKVTGEISPQLLTAMRNKAG